MNKVNSSRIKSFLAIALCFILCTLSIFPVFTFNSSAEEATETTATESTETDTTEEEGIYYDDYGLLLNEHASYTFAVFADGISVGGSNVFNKSSGTCAVSIAKDKSATVEAQILMLKDYTAGSSEQYPNIAQCKAKVTIDLNGYTFYANSSNAMFNLHTKKDWETTIDVINGNVVLKSSALLELQKYTADGKVINMNFENVNFSLAEGSTLTNMIAKNKSKSTDRDTTYKATWNITFTDCVFDVTNAASNITIFKADYPTNDDKPSEIKYVLNGCEIRAYSPDDFTIQGTFNENSTYTSEGLKTNYVIYAEDFDAVTEKVELAAGNNLFGPAKGWIYEQKSTDGQAYIENGRLYFSGNKYDVIYRDGGEVWGNYILEADICYTDGNLGFGGMLYNVHSDNKFQSAVIKPSQDYSLFGYNGNLTNTNTEANLGLQESLFGVGKPFRMKIEVYNKTATLYYAMLDENGSMKTDFIELTTISDIPADAQTGSIGFMTSDDSCASFWVDNIKCYSDTLVSYSENFDSYGDITLEADANNSDMGVYFDKSNTLTNGGAEVKDGALHLSGGGKNYNAIFFNMGKNWTNYAVESDLTYVEETNNSGWGGILFRATDIENFWKGSINPATSGKGTGSLNSQLGGSWYMDYDKSATYQSGPLGYGETVRVRIVVNERVASIYAARYTDGVLGEWEHVFTTVSENKFATIHMQGMIGIIVGGSSEAKEKHIYVDNMTVSRIPGADRLYEAPAAATIYEPTTGIVNPPVVVEKLTSALPNAEGERAAVVMAEIDSNLNVLDENGEIIISVEDFISTYRNGLIPAFVIDDEAEADALATLLYQKELSDAYVVAKAENAALVKRVRLANVTTNFITGALIFDDLNSLEARKEARALVTDNMSYVAISLAPISEEAAFYFALRQVAAWSFADSTAEVYRGIANGYHGIISENVSEIYDVYESITETTVSGKTVVIAHRGANANADVPYPENTLMGIRAAKEVYGADAIEIDFGLTKDEYVVIMHDTTVDRTTNGTGKVSDLTLAEIKALTVDYVAGKETTVPTLEEVLVLAKELDVVLYCHVKEFTNANIAAFTYLVKKYDCSDNVIYFGSSSKEKYNSYTDAVYSGTAYELVNSPVMPDGIGFTAGTNPLSSANNYLEGVVGMKNTYNLYNYQPLIYPYVNTDSMWSAETFYYQLSARGFVNTHSTTNGQEKMDSTALTESGCVGWLTNNPHLCDDYHYGIDLTGEKLTLKLGETIDTLKTLKLIMGTADANCGFVQVGGDTLVEKDGSYTLNETGTATVVYYATRTAEGGSTYRVYSEPVTLMFVPESVASFTPKASVTLDSNLIFNIYLPQNAGIGEVTLNGEKITLDEAVDGYYLITKELSADKAASELKLTVNLTVAGSELCGTYTFSTVKYAEKLLGINSVDATEKTLAKDMLSYIRSAYNYFNAEDKATVSEEIDAVLNGYASTAAIDTGDAKCDVDGLSGATFVLGANPAIRFYLDTYTTDKFSFKVGNRTLSASEANTGSDADGDYIEFTLYAYEMTEVFSYEIADTEISGEYNLIAYYADAVEKSETELAEIVAKFYNYCASAKAYRNSIISE